MTRPVTVAPRDHLPGREIDLAGHLKVRRRDLSPPGITYPPAPNAGVRERVTSPGPAGDLHLTPPC